VTRCLIGVVRPPREPSGPQALPSARGSRRIHSVVRTGADGGWLLRGPFGSQALVVYVARREDSGLMGKPRGWHTRRPGKGAGTVLTASELLFLFVFGFCFFFFLRSAGKSSGRMLTPPCSVTIIGRSYRHFWMAGGGPAAGMLPGPRWSPHGHPPSPAPPVREDNGFAAACSSNCIRDHRIP